MSYVNVTTKMFFDRPSVIAAMSEKSRRVLSSTGAFARTVMRRGMRKRKGISAPGEFPSAHGNPLLREQIYFGLDRDNLQLVTGPTLLNRGGLGFDREIIEGGKTVPQLINEGGVVQRHRAVGRGRTFRRVGEVVRQVYRARPFVKLTLPIAAKKLAENMAKFQLKKGA